MFTPRIFWRVESSADSAGSAMCARHPGASEANAPLSVEDGCETAAASINKAQGGTAYDIYDKLLDKLRKLGKWMEWCTTFRFIAAQDFSNGSSNFSMYLKA